MRQIVNQKEKDVNVDRRENGKNVDAMPIKYMQLDWGNLKLRLGMGYDVDKWTGMRW